MGEAKILDARTVQSIKGAFKSDAGMQKKQSSVDFAEMMGQSMMQQTQIRTAGKIPEKNTEADRKSSSVEFERNNYKDGVIPSKTSESDIRDENVIQKTADEFAENVNQVLKEELGVTDEEIQEAMKALGIGYPDLMNQGNLASLVAMLTGSENVNQLLCSESFVNIMQEVSAISRELLETLQISAEEFKQAVAVPDMEETAELPAADQEVSNVPGGELSENPEELNAEGKGTVLAAAGVSGESQENVSVSAADQQSADENEDKISVVVQKDTTEETSEEETANQNAGSSKEEAGNSKTGTGLHETVDSQPGISTAQNGILERLNGVETVQELPEYVSVREIIEQFVERARVTLTDDLSKMEMQLNPAHLGKLYLEITQQEGAVAAKIQAQNAVVKEALEAQLVDLKQNMEQAGIRVDSVEVTVASHEFERNLEQDAKRQEQQAKEQEKSLKQHRLFRNSLDGLTGLMSEEELLAARIMAEQGNSVDVTA